MTFLIVSIWIVPGFVFTRMTNQKYKRRQLARQAKRVSKLYPPSQFVKGEVYFDIVLKEMQTQLLLKGFKNLGKAIVGISTT